MHVHTHSIYMHQNIYQHTNPQHARLAASSEQRVHSANSRNGFRPPKISRRATHPPPPRRGQPSVPMLYQNPRGRIQPSYNFLRTISFITGRGDLRSTNCTYCVRRVEVCLRDSALLVLYSSRAPHTAARICVASWAPPPPQHLVHHTRHKSVAFYHAVVNIENKDPS